MLSGHSRQCRYLRCLCHGPFRHRVSTQEQDAHRGKDRPALPLVADHAAEDVGQRRADGEDRQRTYQVIGQVFFASADKFIAAFDFKEAIDKVIIDLSRAHFWDITAVAALDKVVIKLRREGTEVEVIGLNTASATIVDRFAVHDKDNPSDLLSGH